MNLDLRNNGFKSLYKSFNCATQLCPSGPKNTSDQQINSPNIGGENSGQGDGDKNKI